MLTVCYACYALLLLIAGLKMETCSTREVFSAMPCHACLKYICIAAPRMVRMQHTPALSCHATRCLSPSMSPINIILCAAAHFHAMPLPHTVCHVCMHGICRARRCCCHAGTAPSHRMFSQRRGRRTLLLLLLLLCEGGRRCCCQKYFHSDLAFER